jgi:hypothetical protein
VLPMMTASRNFNLLTSSWLFLWLLRKTLPETLYGFFPVAAGAAGKLRKDRRRKPRER